MKTKITLYIDEIEKHTDKEIIENLIYRSCRMDHCGVWNIVQANIKTEKRKEKNYFISNRYIERID
jgi:hypothetical protein